MNRACIFDIFSNYAPTHRFFAGDFLKSEFGRYYRIFDYFVSFKQDYRVGPVYNIHYGIELNTAIVCHAIAQTCRYRYTNNIIKTHKIYGAETRSTSCSMVIRYVNRLLHNVKFLRSATYRWAAIAMDEV